MKCPCCHALNAPNDEYCSGCRKPLDPFRQRAADLAAVAATPQWVYFFVALCGAIPIVTLGGAIPILVGLGGAGTCLKVARTQAVPSLVRFILCLTITFVAWLVLVVVLIALFGIPVPR